MAACRTLVTKQPCTLQLSKVITRLPWLLRDFFFTISIGLLNRKSDSLKACWTFTFHHCMQCIHPSLQGTGWSLEWKCEVWVDLKRPFTLPQVGRLVGFLALSTSLTLIYVLWRQHLRSYFNIPLLHNLPCWLQAWSDVPKEKLQPRETPPKSMAASCPPGKPIYLQADSPQNLTPSHALSAGSQQAYDSLLRQILSMQVTTFPAGHTSLLLGLENSKQRQD